MAGRYLGGMVVCLLLVLLPAGLALAAGTQSASAGTMLLLGEVHDNAAGHAARLALLRERVVDGGLRPAIVMEQFDRERQVALDAARADCPDADCLIAKAGQGDWDWPLYRPLIQFALDQRLPLVAANVSRDDAGRALHGGLAAVLDADTLLRHGRDGALPADIAERQFAEIVDGHCGMLPEAVARKMVNAQVARDIWMAKVLADGVAARGSAVLIAGNGHVRRDVGVPRWLPAGVAVEVHGWIEGEAVPGEFDVGHRIAPMVRLDPCEGVRVPG